MQSICWVPSNVREGLPTNAVVQSGVDDKGTPLYVVRAYHNGNHLPGYVNVHRGICEVVCGAKIHRKTYFEYLVGINLQWVADSSGEVPARAILGGLTSNNQKLYIGRIRRGSMVIPGKIHPEYNCLFYPFNGKEQWSKDYEVLVQQLIERKPAGSVQQSQAQSSSRPLVPIPYHQNVTGDGNITTSGNNNSVNINIQQSSSVTSTVNSTSSYSLFDNLNFSLK